MKTKKIGLLAIGLLFLAGAVFVETEDVMAYKCIYGGTCDMSLGGCGWNDSPGDSCDSSSSPNCTVQDDDPSNGTLSVCLVDNLGGGKCCFGQANCDVSCTPGGAPVGSKTDAYRFCKEQKCTDSQDNALYVRDAGNHGVKCWVSEQEEGEFPANIGGKFVQGYWDYYTSRDFSGNFNIGPGKCVTCNGAKEDYILGDSLMNYINQNGGDSSGTQGNGVFEYACGADESCDEKVMGNVCSPPAGGRCNANGICEAAVAATHMACS
ncbi:MAG: hypothetical protein U9Q21_03900, partial [Candidatus Auribacterota bacterium]|nr:hypothetical protein [Candidatus Auribacterota bacterium]